MREGEIVTLIGANGAGKSTTLRSINGLNHPREGTIKFGGEDITERPAHEIVKLGIAQSPEGRRHMFELPEPISDHPPSRREQLGKSSARNGNWSAFTTQSEFVNSIRLPTSIALSVGLAVRCVEIAQ